MAVPYSRVTKEDWAIFLASGFYVGGARVAPGTWGTLVAIPLWLLVRLGPPFFYFLFLLLVIIAGIWAAGVAEKILREMDSGTIVIDEIAGYLLTVGWLPVSFSVMIGGFLLFRFFDILKPFPISWVEKKFKHGLGIMFDDLVAAVLAHLVLRALLGW